MLRTLNLRLKQYAPKLQSRVKRCIDGAEVPLPKLLWGRTMWTHSKLWNHVIWDEAVLRWITEVLQPGDVFFDVGAHQGWLSMAAAWKTGRQGKVVAFEPSPALIHFLRYHKRMNRLTQMEIIPKAVADMDLASTKFILEGDGDSVMNSLIEIDAVKTGPRGAAVIPVEAITLDSYSQQTGLVPNLIKIDTEGAELWVCQGARHLLAHSRPALIIATHPAWLPKGQKIEDLFALLHEYGYRVVQSDALQYQTADFRDYLFLAEEINATVHE